MRRIIIFGVALLLIVLGAVSWLQLSEQSEQKATIASKEAEVQQQNEQREAVHGETVRKLEELENEKGKLDQTDFLSALPAKARAYYEAALNSLEDVKFYGKVVDQHGEPVEGAQVHIDLGGSYVSGGKRGWVKTGKDGLFTVEAEGSSLFITDIKHINYQYKSVIQDSAGNSMAVNFYSSPTVLGDGRVWSDYPKDNPYLFKVWKLEKLEPVIHSGTRGGLEPDGRVYTLNLRETVGWRAIIEGESEGQLRVRAYNGPPVNVNPEFNWPERNWPKDWWVEVTPIDGGIVEVPNDVYLNEAPEVGFVPSIRVEGKASDRNNGVMRNKRYYYTANGGQDYGALIVDFGPGGISVRYKTNPAGSRNLVVRDW